MTFSKGLIISHLEVENTSTRQIIQIPWNKTNKRWKIGERSTKACSKSHKHLRLPSGTYLEKQIHEHRYQSENLYNKNPSDIDIWTEIRLDKVRTIQKM